MIGRTLEELKIGDKGEFAKTITETDVYLFAGITGDLNPAHIDAQYAEKTFFQKRIAHGILLAGFISAVLGNKLPGPGTVYIKQELNFLAPAYLGDTITARAEVIAIENKKVVLKTTCVNQEGRLLVDGTAVVSPPRKIKGEGS